ncbi:sulfate adenylyltransferase subunit CysN [Vibrio natriegens]|jgi:sulfate adenylyltransferase subunit 1|uniref:Sulfate adenylyltransferase subunit 1 n=1 Tax=Vibrio natriegens NBRC 15636 = ATCC 14048 = DSM 759 TaxID=1219067 RepID=A0AAN0Y0M7_VIBNA|nr:sulfate adenylyltransferase subunit CysN [Vibrio natriegens]ALR16716.1 sulfate adenylyltransferase [Vibrio natriegens NBRC 15636 = ATCC 14048 = DSM 759]ANQ11418.1 sulfate adenylyltransferase subunit CysN [Vibrio natriegens NBRC 15636 = ATCC 14048 = DSM 759]EPM38982.1 sulfate adenylyltransferase subunit 1 [Vibrio natriegens NBRC 15636 = ATCC 14048 = DSM 759]MDX6025747.1 sulfate adenylyltransferase subunit CysN [Vibrio natriegens NBRC 15636 = ATCC 14048 = DSM 759]UUI11866.1 sulfate adenylyltr
MSHSSELIATDIEAYLKVHENKDLLRFLTCGNVDDGKSTLIGRLLFDSKLIYEDQMAAIEKDSQKFNTTDEAFDLALLVDGLQSEREQGITIDVAYRYFSTDKRKFIIADTPGHEQYTRNMVTGASTCELAIVMVDARHGIQTQTRRHSYICSLLGIKHIIVAINKMDLMDYSQEVYQKIKADYRDMAKNFDIDDIRFVPISALKGDNVVTPSEHMDWYPGATLMKLLETVKVDQDKNMEQMRFPVQYVNRPNLNFRGFCGTLASGIVRVGDNVTALPSGKASRIKSIYTYDGELEQAQPGQAITLTLEDEIDVSRGDMLVHTGHEPTITNKLEAHVVWMDEAPMRTHKEYSFKFATKTCVGKISEIEHKVDVNTLDKHAENAETLELNEIALTKLSLTDKVAVDKYQTLPQTGSFVIIDRHTNVTVGAGMISATSTDHDDESRIYSTAEKELNAYVRKHFPEWGCAEI